MNQEENTLNPLHHVANDYEIVINHSKEAVEKELFKFIPKTENHEFEIPADLILEMIAKNFKTKEVASALLDSTTQTVPAVEASLPVHFTTTKSYKKGEIVQFTAPIILPYFFAAVMDAYKLAILDKKTPVLPIPQAMYEQAFKQVEEKNKKFVQTLWKKEIDTINKAKAAETTKAVDNKVEPSK